MKKILIITSMVISLSALSQTIEPVEQICIEEHILEFEALYQSKVQASKSKDFKNVETVKKAALIEVLGHAIKSAHMGHDEDKVIDSSSFIKANFLDVQIPFILLGMDKVPAPVIGFASTDVWTDPNCKASYDMRSGPYSWQNFLENQGLHHCSLDNPDQVLETVIENYQAIMTDINELIEDYNTKFIYRHQKNK